MMGSLHCGDNLEILRDSVPDASVDLIYLDPPFNSRRAFRTAPGASGAEDAFHDRWSWPEVAPVYVRAQEDSAIPPRLRSVLRSLRDALEAEDPELLAYLVMMAARLVELHRTMRPAASLYLHCDPTASHYLKVLLDMIFGPGRFRSEIVWKRSAAHSDARQGRALHGHVHDTLLFYTKGDAWTWNALHLPHDEAYIASKYRFVEEATGRLYRKDNLTVAKPGGDTSYEWRGARPYPGRYWAYSKAKMAELERENRLVYTRSGMPEYKRYLDESPGLALQDVWTDIDPVNSQAGERVGYPTQKPLALLERIVRTSSNEGDLVLDPFCGSGTALEAALRLGRRWIGIDIAPVAIRLAEERLRAPPRSARGIVPP